MRKALVWLAGLLMTSPQAHAAMSTNFASKLAPVAPCSQLSAAARARHIPLEGIDAPGETRRLVPGDSLTALVTLFVKGAPATQWLLYVQALPEQTSTPSNKPTRVVMHSSFGPQIEFLSRPARVALRTLGPFDASGRNRKPPRKHDQTARFSLNQDFLGLGLDQTAVALLRLKELKVKGTFGFRGYPFTEEEIARNLQQSNDVRLTAEEQRAVAGSVPALMSYFNVVQQTEGLSDILFDLIDLPSMWSMVRKGGVATHFRFVNERLDQVPDPDRNYPGAPPAFYLPLVLELNNQTALNLTFVVTRPRPPLLACGGIVSMLAEKPGDEKTYLSFRLLSARRASTSPQAAVLPAN